MNEVVVSLQKLPHPCSTDRNAPFELWGLLSVEVLVKNSKQSVTTLKVQWDLLTFIDWFIENLHSITTEYIGFCKPNESLAQSLKRHQDRDFEENEEEIEDEWFEELFKFRKSHAIRFAFRGADLKDIIIGYNHEAGEISFSDDEVNWAYSFDMNAFCKQTAQHAESFIQKSDISNLHPKLALRLTKLVQKLRNIQEQDIKVGIYTNRLFSKS